MRICCNAIYLSSPCDGVPNSALPLLYYSQVANNTENNAAAWFEFVFARHGWPPRWRYPIYDFIHFYSTTHEALGIYQGQAHIQFGGARGPVVHIARGDAVVIPAGVGHRQVSASRDFMVVGAYPQGCSVDLCRDRPERLAAVRHRISLVPLPDGDPLTSKTNEGCYRHWRCGESTDSDRPHHS